MLRVINLAKVVFWISVPLFAVVLALRWSVSVILWPVLISSAILTFHAYISGTMRKDEGFLYATAFCLVVFGVGGHVLP